MASTGLAGHASAIAAHALNGYVVAVVVVLLLLLAHTTLALRNSRGNICYYSRTLAFSIFPTLESVCCMTHRYRFRREWQKRSSHGQTFVVAFGRPRLHYFMCHGHKLLLTIFHRLGRISVIMIIIILLLPPLLYSGGAPLVVVRHSGPCDALKK